LLLYIQTAGEVTEADYAYAVVVVSETAAAGYCAAAVAAATAATWLLGMRRDLRLLSRRPSSACHPGCARMEGVERQ
jgi:hypothetical protein